MKFSRRAFLTSAVWSVKRAWSSFPSWHPADYWTPSSSSVYGHNYMHITGLLSRLKEMVHFQWIQWMQHMLGRCIIVPSSFLLLKCSSFLGVSPEHREHTFWSCLRAVCFTRWSPHGKSVVFQGCLWPHGKVWLILESRTGELIAVAHLSHTLQPHLYQYQRWIF